MWICCSFRFALGRVSSLIKAGSAFEFLQHAAWVGTDSGKEKNLSQRKVESY